MRGERREQAARLAPIRTPDSVARDLPRPATLQSDGLWIEQVWNNAWTDRDHQQIKNLMAYFQVSAVNGLIGKRIYATGASGFGSFKATITNINEEKGWIEVEWEDATRTWKTAKLIKLQKW